MRRGTFAILATIVFVAHAQAGGARVNGQSASWQDVLARAARERKPIVVLFRTADCSRCDDFVRKSVPHPAIQRRMPSVIFEVLPGDESRVVFFDRSGSARAAWPLVPDTTNFGVILDSVIAVAPHFERAVDLRESGKPQEAELEAAIGLVRLGRTTDARTALASAREHGNEETRHVAALAIAFLDANERKSPKALAVLEQLVAEAEAKNVSKAGWHAMARQALDAFHAARAPAGVPVIRVLPLPRQVVSGPHRVRTHVGSTAVAHVTFELDGLEVARVRRPPFSTTLDFGNVPERRVVRVAAFDRKGNEIGRHERVVNEAGESFWLRLIEPRQGPAGGTVRVSMSVRAPAAGSVRRVVVAWNDAERVVLTAPPWAATISIPQGRVGVLSAVAELDDGRTSEDAVLLNAEGAVAHADVQLVELPITVINPSGHVPEITPGRLSVREGSRLRRVESVSTADETPLTIGILIDASDSMQSTLPDVQEAAIRFVETMLDARDRAFLVTFDTRARLVQPATSDVALLRRQIMSARLDGLTALHDAIALGLLQFEGVKGRRALIVFTDGIDLTSAYSASDVSELARRVHVPVHVIAPPPAVPEETTDDSLQRVATSTGATFHNLDDLAGLPAAFSRIAAALRAQVLAFVRTDRGTAENEWRSIEVKVRGDDLEVFAPSGYYAPW